MTTVPLKRLAKIRVSNVDKKSVDGQTPVRLCNYTDVYYRAEVDPGQSFMSATASREQIRDFALQPDDVIITKDSETAHDIGVPTYVRATAPDLICGYHLAIIRPDPRVLDGRYLYWFMSSSFAREQLSQAATGVTRFGLRSESTGALSVHAWELHRQQAIANYLDTETARIDALIAAKTQQSKLLQIRLQVNAHALTDGGRKVPLRRLVRSVRTGSTPPSDVFAGLQLAGDVAWLSPGDVGDALAMRPPARRLQSRAIDDKYCPAFAAESTLVVGIGATAGRVGHLAYRATGNQQMTCVEAGARLLPRYLSWSLWARQDQLRATAPYTTLPIITNDFLRSFPIWCPSTSEQSKIVSQLDSVAAKTALARERLARQVALLREHRQALITAAVTGQLEIPGVAS